MTAPATHGGRREGAGRKPAPVRMVRFVMSMEPDLYAALRAASQGDGSMAEIVREALRAWLSSHSLIDRAGE